MFGNIYLPKDSIEKLQEWSSDLMQLLSNQMFKTVILGKKANIFGWRNNLCIVLFFLHYKVVTLYLLLSQPAISSNPISADRTVINDYAVWVIKCLLIHNPQSSVSWSDFAVQLQEDAWKKKPHSVVELPGLLTLDFVKENCNRKLIVLVLNHQAQCNELFRFIQHEYFFL